MAVSIPIASKRGKLGAGFLISLVLLTGCGSLQVENAYSVGEADWLTEGASPQRSYMPIADVAPPLEEVWSYNAGAAFGPGSPLLLGDNVIVATRRGEVHVVDLTTGKRRGVKEFGDAVEGTPAIENGVIYIPVAWGKRALYAHDLTSGETLWSMKDAPIEAGILVSGDQIIVVDAESRVRGINARSGEIEWERALDSLVTVLASPVATGDHAIVVADDRGGVLALSTTDGRDLWRTDIGMPVHATPSSNEDLVFLPTTRGHLVALDTETGAIRWTYAVEGKAVYISTPAVSESEVVFGASDGKLRALDATSGALRWTFDAGEGFAAAPLIAAHTVFAGGLDGKLYAVERATGRLVWEQQLEGRIKSALAARDEYIVVTSEPQNVYLFKAADAYARSK